MEKKIYITPSIKMRSINNESLLNTVSQGISEDPATGPAQSKGNHFFDKETETRKPVYNIWE